MKIAAIDIGSNSIHMIIVEIGASGGLRLIDRETEMVRLGSGTLTTGVLPGEARRRALKTLGAYTRLAKVHGVDEILAVSTSAVREAQNGEEFLDEIAQKTGIVPRAIPGEEEARLIALAALASIRTDGRHTVVVDIGGGSLELALCSDGQVRQAMSFKLGALRMTERFLKHDPPSPGEERRLEAHVEETAGVLARHLGRTRPVAVIGTSGTILALGRLALEAGTGERAEALHHATVSAPALRSVRRRLRRLGLRGRWKVPGLDRRRADTVVAGAIVLDTVLGLLGAKRLILCEWSLREGLILDYIQRHSRAIARARAIPDVRRRSVLELAERCLYDEAHCRHVAHLAVELFDATRRRHHFGAEERALLEFAALLHDVGHHIAHEGHHKHSHYLIKNGGLRGFDPAEIDLIASVARYHRRGEPSRKHPAFAALPGPARRSVEVLSGLLRLADGLDRSHRQRVRSVSLTSRGRGVEVRCRSIGEAELESWGAGRRTSLLEKALGVPVRVRFAPVRTQTAARTAARAEDRSGNRNAGRSAARTASQAASRSARHDALHTASRGPVRTRPRTPIRTISRTAARPAARKSLPRKRA